MRFGRMMLNKVQRMWTRYARGGARPTRLVDPRLAHRCSSSPGSPGSCAGALARRDLLLGVILLAVLYSTALHMLVVSQARYNLPLMPALIAGGVAGWVLWWRGRA